VCRMDWLLVSKRSPEALERRRSLKLALENEGPKWVLTSDREDVTLVFTSTVMSGRGRWGSLVQSLRLSRFVSLFALLSFIPSFLRAAQGFPLHRLFGLQTR